MANLIILSFVSWFKMFSQYGADIIFLLGFSRTMQISQDDASIAFKLHNFVQVVHFTINVKNFTIFLFIWINMWKWNKHFF
jgi:hypothetical protein